MPTEVGLSGWDWPKQDKHAIWGRRLTIDFVFEVQRATRLIALPDEWTNEVPVAENAKEMGYGKR